MNSLEKMEIAKNIVKDCYNVVSTKGGNLPQEQTLSNLPSSIYSINGSTEVLNFPIVDLSSSSTVYTTAIDPNKMYLFGEKETLTISGLTEGLDFIVNEYMFQFTSGNVATTLNVPNSVVWLKEPDIQTNKIYQVSIENNLGIIGEWSNE